MIQLLTQDVLVSLLDESAFLNESLVWFKDKYILTAPFHYNVINKSSFEVSNYFQKMIYSILIATVHIRVYIWTINFLQYFCDLNVCNRNNDTVVEKTVKRFHSWQMTAALFMSAAARTQLKCSNHTDVYAAWTNQVITTLWSYTSKVEEWNRWIIVIGPFQWRQLTSAFLQSSVSVIPLYIYTGDFSGKCGNNLKYKDIPGFFPA